MKRLFKKNEKINDKEKKIRSEIQELKNIYGNKEDYSIEKLKDRIVELNYFIHIPKGEVFFEGLKTLLTIIAILFTFSSANSILNKGDLIIFIQEMILLLVTIIGIEVTVFEIQAQQYKISKKMIERDIIENELNRRRELEEKKINRNKRIHENIRR